MNENRTKYPKKKSSMYAQLQILPTRYKVVALVRMEKIRATQILQLRKKLKDQVEFVSIKDKVAVKALETVDVSGIEKIIPDIKGQCMLFFTNTSPFRLSMSLDKNKVMLPARGGDVASVDVVVPARNTGIAPGPMLTEFKDAGIPTKIDQGTIWIAKDTTPVKKGEIIGEKLAAMLGKLDIKPIEAGISLDVALESGSKYTQEDMMIDVDAVTSLVAQAHQEAANLSIEAAYVTPTTIIQILAKGASSARSLSIESAYTTKDTLNSILGRAHANANALMQKSDYTPSS